MIRLVHSICDEEGLHARPVAILCSSLEAFESDATVFVDGKSASARNALSLMGLGAVKGDELVIEVEGSDEVAAAQALEKALLTF